MGKYTVLWRLNTAGYNAKIFSRALADVDQFIKEQSRRVSGMEMSNHSHAVKKYLAFLSIFIGIALFHVLFLGFIVGFLFHF